MAAPVAPAAGHDSPTRPGPKVGETSDATADGDRPGSLAGVVLPALSLGLALALTGLTRRPLWTDEALSLGSTEQLLDTFAGTAGAMSLYYALLDGWAVMSTSVAWLRGLSVICAVAAVVPTAAIVARADGRRVAAGASLILAAAYATTRYAQEARGYALVVLLAAATWWTVDRARRAAPGRDRPWWRATALLGCALVLTHGLAVFHLLALAAALALGRDRRTSLLRFAPAVVAPATLVVIMAGSGAEDIGAWAPRLSWSSVTPLATTFLSPVVPAAMLLGACALVGVGAGVHRARAGEDPWTALAPVVLAAVPVVLLLAAAATRPMLVDRYVICVVPALAVVIARGAATAADAACGRIGRVGRVVVAGLLVAALAAGQGALRHEPYDHWQDAAEVIADQARPGDGIYFAYSFQRPPFEAAWRGLDPAGGPPVPLTHERPLGGVLHYDEPLGEDEVARRIEGVERAWLVMTDDPYHDVLDAVLDRPTLADGFTGARQTDVGDGTVVVLLTRT